MENYKLNLNEFIVCDSRSQGQYYIEFWARSAVPNRARVHGAFALLVSTLWALIPRAFRLWRSQNGLRRADMAGARPLGPD